MWDIIFLKRNEEYNFRKNKRLLKIVITDILLLCLIIQII